MRYELTDRGWFAEHLDLRVTECRQSTCSKWLPIRLDSQVLSDLARSASKHMNDNRVQILQEQRQRNTELPARNVGLVERHSRNIRLTGTAKHRACLKADPQGQHRQ
jgi:hypothetical protein